MPIKSPLKDKRVQERNVLEEITRVRKEFLSHPENCPSYDAIPGKRQILSGAIRETNKSRKGRMAVVAELKFASPSAGVIRSQNDLDQLITQIQAGGACGMSVLTEPHYFHGSFENLRNAATRTHIPLLMKDFLVDPYQVRAGQACGASNILVIAEICDFATFLPLIETNHIEPLVEIHSEQDLPVLRRIQPNLVGVNNRNLHDFKFNFETSHRLIPMIRDMVGDDVVIISESGIRSRTDIELLHSYGADGFLVGSSLMEANDVRTKLQELVG